MQNKVPIFILTYRNLEYFSQWWPEAESSLAASDLDYHLVVVDNGQQDIKSLPIEGMTAFQTGENIGCAGGWNLCADIGFESFGYDKIIIGQEDAKFDEEILRRVFDSTDENNIYGAYEDGFTFSLFGLHQNVWNRVGRFDENLVFVTHEDCDYTQRCYREGIGVNSLGFSKTLNANLESQSSRGRFASQLNKAYMDEKWGEEWNREKPRKLGFHQNFVNVYGEREEFPSVKEYRWMKDVINTVLENE